MAYQISVQSGNTPLSYYQLVYHLGLNRRCILPDVCLVAPSGECLRGYKPRAADCSRLVPRVAASCLAKPSCYRLLPVVVRRYYSLCCPAWQLVSMHCGWACDLTVIKGKMYLFLLIPRTRTSYCDRSFSVRGPTVWNSLPYDLRSTETSLNTFKNKLKTFLFDADTH